MIKSISGLASIIADYDGLLVDMWGVMHNGGKIFPAALNAVKRCRLLNKRLVFVSNVPRPYFSVVPHYNSIGLDDKYYDGIITAGDIVRIMLQKRYQQKFFHIGPPRDTALYDDLPMERTFNIFEADFILCTGANDDLNFHFADYHDLFSEAIASSLVMICANPDKIVQAGGQMVVCAGTLAEYYENLGGVVEYYGKPYPDIYKKALAALNCEKVLAICDGLATDIKGANSQHLPCLLVNNGIHEQDWGNPPILSKVESDLTVHKLTITAFIPVLCW